jgi:genome maintenance exonuclease 1
MFNHIGNSLIELPEPVTVNGVRHYPVPNGSKYPSITSVTTHKNKEFFADWRKKVGDVEADRICKVSTSRGTVFHKYAEDYLNNLQVAPKNLTEQISASWQMFESAKPYLDNINNIHALEAPLYSDDFRIAGRVDCIAEYNGELAIIDFKTSGKLKREDWIEHYFVQCMAYGYAYWERTGIEIDKIVVMIACQDGEMQIFEKYDKMMYHQLLLEYVNEFFEYHNGAKFANVKG